MKRDAVIFDLFGTLVDSNPKEEMLVGYLEPAALLTDDPQTFADTWFGLGIERSTGKYKTVEGDVLRVCDLLGLSPSREALDAALLVRMRHYRKYLQPRPTALDTLSKLRSSGMKIGLVSDCGLEIADVWEDGTLAPFFDTAVFSSKAGVVKPDPSLFALACEGLGVEAARCIYVGDGGGRELTGARAAGMHPILIRVDYEGWMDAYRPDALAWRGPVISDISQVLDYAGLRQERQ